MGKLSLESTEGINVGHVGTGFTDEQREEIWQNSDKWLGEIIEVEAEALGEQGRLRFPRYQRDRRDTGTADSIEKIRKELPEA